MKYNSGEAVLLGDIIELEGGMTGVVVAIINAGEFSDGYPAKQWHYLETGVLVESPEGGLIHYPGPITDFNLIKRLDR